LPDSKEVSSQALSRNSIEISSQSPLLDSRDAGSKAPLLGSRKSSSQVPSLGSHGQKFTGRCLSSGLPVGAPLQLSSLSAPASTRKEALGTQLSLSAPISNIKESFSTQRSLSGPTLTGKQSFGTQLSLSAPTSTEDQSFGAELSFSASSFKGRQPFGTSQSSRMQQTRAGCQDRSTPCTGQCQPSGAQSPGHPSSHQRNTPSSAAATLLHARAQTNCDALEEEMLRMRSRRAASTGRTRPSHSQLLVSSTCSSTRGQAAVTEVAAKVGRATSAPHGHVQRPVAHASPRAF